MTQTPNDPPDAPLAAHQAADEAAHLAADQTAHQTADTPPVSVADQTADQTAHQTADTPPVSIADPRHGQLNMEPPPTPDTTPQSAQAAGPTTSFAAEVREVGLGAIQTLTPGMTPESPAQMTARVGSIPAADRQRRWARRHAFNWRLALMRLLSAALAVNLTVLVVPGLSLSRWYWGSLLIVGIIFGLLNALLKPVLQFLVLRFIFSTYGAVVVLINSVLLWALDQLTDGLVEIDGILAAILGGLGVGAFGLIFETILGANPPILDSRNSLEAPAQ